MVFGEVYSEVKEAINVNVNEYIVLLDKANNANPIRHIRGPSKVYPSPYEELILDENRQAIRKCIEVNDATALWLKQPDGLVLLIDQPQFYMPRVGERIERTVSKTLLKESEFCIMIAPSGQMLLRMGNQPEQRAFFLPPFHKFLPFKMGPLTLDSFHQLPDYIPLGESNAALHTHTHAHRAPVKQRQQQQREHRDIEQHSHSEYDFCCPLCLSLSLSSPCSDHYPHERQRASEGRYANLIPDI